LALFRWLFIAQRVQPLKAASATNIITIRMRVSCALHCIGAPQEFFKADLGAAGLPVAQSNATQVVQRNNDYRPIQ
jgi:hypothetical protein